MTANELIEDWEEKLIPIKEPRIRSMMNEVMAKAGIIFRLYDLKSLFTSWMIQYGAPRNLSKHLPRKYTAKQFEAMVNRYLQPVLEK